MPPMIQIRHLRKEYPAGLVAVKDLSLELNAGDIFGFIGPNGAGKTTTIKMLATLLIPTARIEIKELLKELRAMGKTIIISSHILPELSDFCNKIGIIEKGEMIVAGDVNDIVRQIVEYVTLEVRILEESVDGEPTGDLAAL